MILPGVSSERFIRGLLARHPHDRAELLPVLDALNSELGYLSRTAIKAVARHFHLPLYQVYGPATFYAMWKIDLSPTQAVHLCDDGPCHVAGAADVRRALGQAGVQVQRISCLGQCSHGPVVTTGTRLYR